jgi:deoxyadenosine/deoxycytidine kinase
MTSYSYNKPILISIEGNIGSGKTTILEKLESRFKSDPSILFLREPLDVWEAVKDSETGENILEKFYSNPEKYAFPFQVMAYSSRLSMIRNAINNNPYCKVIVCERSLDADKNIFAKMLHDDGKIDNMCYQIYEKFYSGLSDEIILDGIVYIDADAEVCHQRVEKRNRQGEDGISLEYLQKCKDYHDEWLLNDPLVCRIKTNQPVTYDPRDSKDEGNVWLQEITDYVRNVEKHKDEYLEWKHR